MRAINLFGGPGSGKSTTAAGLFWLMKNRGLRVELVTEYAKAMAWANREGELTDQFYVYAKQHHRQHVLREQVDWMITDSPLLLSLLYANPFQPPSFLQFVLDNWNTYQNCNYYVVRVKPYVKLGRFQDEEGAKLLDRRTESLLDLHNVPYRYVLGNERSAHHILTDLEESCPELKQTTASLTKAEPGESLADGLFDVDLEIRRNAKGI